MSRMVYALCMLMVLATVASAQSSKNENLIRGYFGGFVKKDWSQVAEQLHADFTFTSPAPDDHIDIEHFKVKCWPQAEHIKDFEFERIFEFGDEAVAIMKVITMDNKLIRNVEYFKFNNGKILSIEVFFGGSGAGFPTNAK